MYVEMYRRMTVRLRLATSSNVNGQYMIAFQWTGLALLSLGYAVALSYGRLGAQSLIAFALLLAVAAAVRQNRSQGLRLLGHGLFVVLALALALHWLPGFAGARVIDSVRFTVDAVPFSMYLNLDKPLIAYWLVLVCPWIVLQRSRRDALLSVATLLPATALLCLGAAMLMGMIGWAPKWPDQAWLWALNNLLLVSLTEEALFRGYVQGGLSRLLKSRPYGDSVALVVASVLFGLAHIGAGAQWVLLGSIAGLGYGLAYRQGGLLAAVLTHFGLNLLHFALFSYPMLMP